ncbi:MAG: hypothetical protein LBS66_00415 [Rhodospirillaceae bacterium]|jgi:hypothetical protein|nr:hypothetical protein [Rhodospirillaceae bacterium]
MINNTNVSPQSRKTNKNNIFINQDFWYGLIVGTLVSLIVVYGIIIIWPNLSDTLLINKPQQTLDHGANQHISDHKKEYNVSDSDSNLIIQNLAHKISTLEDQAILSNSRMTVLIEKSNKLANDISKLNTEIHNLDYHTEISKNDDLTIHNTSSQTLSLVVNKLCEAVNHGIPYESELQAVNKILIFSNNSTILKDLSFRATQGIPSKETLVNSWQNIDKNIQQNVLLPSTNDFWHHVLYKISLLISIKKINNQESDIVSIMTRAEARIKEGDLPNTVQELMKLDATTPQLNSWLKDAKNRVVADRILSELLFITTSTIN